MPESRCCGADYASHDWRWVGVRRSCAWCGLEDLGGRRLVAQVLDGLAAAGVRVVPVPPGQ